MARRSTRLMLGGYYQSDEDSDSSSVTVSYRESPVRVCKKRTGGRKAGSSQAGAIRSAVTGDQSNGSSPALQSSQEAQTMGTERYMPTYATPRPSLTPSTAPGQRPVPSPSVDAPPETGSCTGLYGCSRPEYRLQPHQQLNQRGIDSSGYSSSEDQYRKPAGTLNVSSTSSVGTRSRGPSSRSQSWVSSASAVVAAQTRMFLTALENVSFSTWIKRALCLLLLLIIIAFLGIGLLSLLSSATKTPTIVSEIKPVTSFPASTVPPETMVDPVVLSAAIEKRMQILQRELAIKQENFYSKMEERLQSMRARLEALDSETRAQLEREVGALSRQLVGYQSDYHSSTSSLSLRLQTLEEDNAKLTQELSSVQAMPPLTPCSDHSTAPPSNQLTLELQQAMEKWFVDWIEEQGKGRLGDKDCGRPMADRMPDFALESQGASVVSTRCSETYHSRSACLTLFGIPLWYPSESPRTVIQGYPVLLPGKCWAFRGVQGTLLISLSHPVRISHVTLDHLPRSNAPTGRIDSAPKDFQVYGMTSDSEEGTLLGNFTYDQDGDSTQTFELPNPPDEAYRFAELRVLSNWGHMEYTCVYRFRVHGKINE